MKKIIIIGGIVVLAGVGTIVGALYTQTWNPMWNPFRPTPQEVISEMTTKMEGLDSVHSNLSITLKELETGNGILIRSVSDIDQKNKEKLKEHSKLDFTFLWQGKSYPFSLETIISGESSYWKIKTMPDFSDLLALIPESEQLSGSYMPSIFNSLKDQIKEEWIKIDQESIEELYKEMGIPYPESQFEFSKAQQRELQEKLTSLLRTKKLYYVEAELPDQKIQGKKVYHYRLVVNKEGIKSLIPEILDTLIEYSSTSLMEQGMSSKEAKKVLEEIDLPLLTEKIFEKIGDIKYELWIGHKDKYLYRVKFDKEVELKNIQEALTEYLLEIASEKEFEIEKIDETLQKVLKGKALISGTIDFSDFNRIGEIKAPDDFLTIKEIIERILRGIFFGIMMEQGKMDTPIPPMMPEKIPKNFPQ